MEDNEDEPDDVRNATPVADDVKKGTEDKTAGKPIKADGKKKDGKLLWCDKTARKTSTAKSAAECCRSKTKKPSKTPKTMSVMVYSPPCNFSKLEIIPRHCLSKQEYTDLLATPSRKCPMACLAKTVARKIRPISGRMNELAQPARRLIVSTLQERGESLPPEMINNLVKTIEGSACMTPEQAERYFRDKKSDRVKDRKCGRNGKQKCKGKVKTKCPSTLDKEAVMSQYLMAESFVKSILQWKCPIPVGEFKDIAKVILRRLSFVLKYTPDEREDIKSQQMRFLADIIACWISSVLFEVAEECDDDIEDKNVAKEDQEEEEEEDQTKKRGKKLKKEMEDSEDEDDEEKNDVVVLTQGPGKDPTGKKGPVVVKLEPVDSEEIEKKRKEAEEKAKKEAEEKAKKEAEEQAKYEAEKKKKRELEEAAEKEAQKKRDEERKKRWDEEDEVDKKRKKEAEERRKKEDEEDKERRAKKLKEEAEEDERRKKKRQEEEDADNKRRKEAEERRKKEEAEEEAERKKKKAESERKKLEEEKIKQFGPKIAIDKIGEGKLFKTDIPFVTFGKIMDTVYQMLEDEPEGDETDIIHNRIQRAVYEKLSQFPVLEGPYSLTENLKDVIDVLSGKTATWIQRLLKDNEINFLRNNPPQVDSGEVRDWGKWIDQVTDRAEDWADWIHCVVNDAEKKSDGVNRGDWQNWTSDTETNALLWRRYYLETLHQAHHNKMMVADRPVVKTGNKITDFSPDEKEINNTDLRT